MVIKKLFIFLIILLITPVIYADKVAVVIGFPDGSIHAQCLEANAGLNGYELLKDISLETLWSDIGSFGHQLCKVNNVGDDITGNSCSYSGKYWRFLSGIDNKWGYMPVGFDGGNGCWKNDLNSYNGHYCVKDKDIIGLSYAEYSDPKPTLYSFDKICNPLEINKIKVYVDGGKQSNPDESGGTIKSFPESKIKFNIEIGNNFAFNNSLKIENIEAEIRIIDPENGKVLNKNINFKSLNVNDKYDKDLEIVLPNNLEKDDYDIELIINSYANKIKQKTVIDYDLEIDHIHNKNLDNFNNNELVKEKEIEKDNNLESEKNSIHLDIKKAIPQKTTTNSDLQKNSVIILLSLFLIFLISSIILLMVVLNK